MKKLPSIMKLEASLHERPWGGTFLKSVKNRPFNGILGESWEASLLLEGPSKVNGVPLTEMLNDQQMPYLVKFLDTADYLSVQVHPDDAYAMKYEKNMPNPRGKTECWVVLKSAQDAGIFLGVKKGVSKDAFFRALESKEDITQMMNFYPVVTGDFFYVPAGSLHAIGKNITLVEVQQSCGLTYRVWDWNRLDSKGKSRELHIEKAKQVVNFNQQNNTHEFFKYTRNVFNEHEKALVSHKDFSLTSFALSKSQSEMKFEVKGERLCTVVVGNGEIIISKNGVQEIVGPFQSALLATDLGNKGEYTLKINKADSDGKVHGVIIQ